MYRLLLLFLALVLLPLTAGVASAQSCDYRVQAGDNLGAIAWRHQLTLAELLALNQLADHKNFYVGQCLSVQGSGQPNVPASNRQRIGVSGTPERIVLARQLGLQAELALNWRVTPPQQRPAGVTMWQMVQIVKGKPNPATAQLAHYARQMPGSVWIVGNEPDVIWQDNLPAAQYAQIYHDVYHAIKEADPTAKVAVGAVASPTPLRLQYLDAMLTAYRNRYGSNLPTDMWTVHAYLLREERGSWGMEIPPGMHWVQQGTLYEIDQHDDAIEMQRLIVNFRQWMAARGYRNVPLAITEWGILLPADYGFPPDSVSNYMRTMVSFMLNARSAASGYPQDDNRLVQYGFWFSLYDRTEEFSVSDLINPQAHRLTPIGYTYAALLRQR